MSKALELSQLANDITYTEGTDTLSFGQANITIGSNALLSYNTFSGDLTVAGNGAVTLATVNSNVGSFGSGSAIPVVTVNAKGLVTAVSTQSVNIVTTTDIAGDSGTDTITLGTDTLTFAGGTGLTSAVTNNNVSIALDNTAVSAGSYGGSTAIPVITIDAQGRITAASTSSINTDLVSDTSPQLGGTLDANGNTIDMGTNVLTDTNLGQFITAYGWGNHASAGYLTSISADSINDTHIDFGTGSNQVSTADIPEQTNLYYTDARADARITNALGGNVTITGDLTVNGTTTTVNSNTVNIGDNIIVLNSDETGTPSQNGGIEIERGTSTNVSLRFNETTDKWQFTNDGTTYSDIGDSDTGNISFSGNVISSTGDIELTPTSGSYVKLNERVYIKDGGDVNPGYEGQDFNFYGGGSTSTTFYGASGQWRFSDNTQVFWGQSSDFSIEHENSNNRTIAKIGNHPFRFASKTDSGTLLEMSDQAGVKLYHNNSQKLETTSTGVTVTGTVAATAFTGDGSALTGLSPDYTVSANHAFRQISDGSNQAVADSNIDTFIVTAGTDISAVVTPASDTLTITNTSTLDSVTTRGATTTTSILFPDNVKARFGDTSSPDMEIYHDGSNSYIDDTGTGSLFIRSGTTYIQNAAGNKTAMATNSGAEQTLYHNNSPKFATSATGIAVTGDVDVSTGHIVRGTQHFDGGATGGAGDMAFIETDNTVNNNYSISSNRNAMTVGPVTVASGATVTVPSGQRWIIL